MSSRKNAVRKNKRREKIRELLQSSRDSSMEDIHDSFQRGPSGGSISRLAVNHRKKMEISDSRKSPSFSCNFRISFRFSRNAFAFSIIDWITDTQ